MNAAPPGDRGRFEALAAGAFAELRGSEILLVGLAGEESDFVRFNGHAVRQAGSVSQQELSLELVDGRRHSAATTSLSGDPDLDRPRLDAVLERLREQLRFVPEDPYLAYSEATDAQEQVLAGRIPERDDVVGLVIDELGRTAGAGAGAGAGADGEGASALAAIYAAGRTVAGFASSLGQRDWFEATTFNLDWSLHVRDDRAAAGRYAGSAWDEHAFGERAARSAQAARALRRDPVDLRPGEYRAYLSPHALVELMGMLSWGGFSLKAHRSAQTPLLRMLTQGATLSSQVTLRERIAGAATPGFQEQGFRKPSQVTLLDAGRYGEHLVSPRSGVEYGVPTNGASEGEWPVALDMAPGDLANGSVLEALGTGLAIGDLWYLNFSDRSACRTTGMTRFATFWVEGGEIAAPLNVARFDDTVYHLLGDRLVGLTDEAELVLDAGTYERRSTSSMRLPGALVEAMTFTL